MTAADILTSVYSKQFLPGQEVVVLTASHGETYTAKGLSVVNAAAMTFNESPATATTTANVALSGKVATINCFGLTDKKVTLVLYGN